MPSDSDVDRRDHGRLPDVHVAVLEEQRQGFDQIGSRLVEGRTLRRDIHLKALGNEPVALPSDGRSESHGHSLRHRAECAYGLPLARSSDANAPAKDRGAAGVRMVTRNVEVTPQHPNSAAIPGPRLLTDRSDVQAARLHPR